MVIENAKKLKKILEYREVKLNALKNSDIPTQSLFDYIGKCNCVYSPEDLENLKHYFIPVALNELWQVIYSPDGVDMGADVHLLSLEEFFRENTSLLPASLIIKYGYLAFASTTGGNAICVNLNSDAKDPEIIIADCSVFCDEEILLYKMGAFLRCKLNQSVVDENVKLISPSLSSFIDGLITGAINDVEEFL